MNPFVDTQKRGIELPEGCKDLFDILQTTAKQSDSRSRYKLVAGLQEAERFLAGLLLAPTNLTYISIDLPRQQHHVQLCPCLNALCIVLRVDSADTGRLRHIRKLLRDTGSSPISDSFGGIANNAPFTVLVYPLPIGAPDAAELVTRVLREGFAVTEEAQLYISYNEKSLA